MPFPRNLTEIDHLTRPDHYYLSENDVCYFLGEYTAHESFTFSETNSIISNLKKTLDRRERPEWHYKTRDIFRAGLALGNAISDYWRQNAVFVPIPPSKAKGDPLYDDRMVRVLQAIDNRNPVQVREIILQTESTEAAHEGGVSRDPDRIKELYSVNESLCDPPPGRIVICDDVLTTGGHFKAMQSTLVDLFPEATICGIFIARRVLSERPDNPFS